MAKTLQFRRGTTAEISAITGAAGELFVDLSKDTLVVMDGTTQGGQTLQKELVSGTNIKTINGESLLGSGNIIPDTDLSQVMEDVIPAIDEVYDIGTVDNKWYNGYFTNMVALGDISLSAADNSYLSVNSDILAQDIIVNDIIADSILLDSVSIIDNVITPLDTPLYGQREVIVDGGLTIASRDPAYIKLSQLIGTTTNIIEYNVNFSAQTYIGYYADTSLIVYPDVGPLLQTFLGDSSHNGEMWIAKSNNNYSLNNPSEWNAFKAEAVANLIPGKTYTITFGPGLKIDSNYPNTNTFSPGSYEAEYVGTGTYNANGGTLEFLIFKTPVELTGVIGLTADTNYWFNNPNNDRNTAYFLNINKQEIEEETIIDDSVLATYGSEGMLRFNPITKSFEGHNGTEWGPIGGGTGGAGLPEVSPGVFEIDGELIVTGNVTSLSDQAIKENVEPIQNALHSVLSLQGVTYTTAKSKKRNIGFIANNAEKIVPEIVHDTTTGLKSVAYANTVALLVEAIKEQQIQIDQLKAKLNGI